MRLSHLKVEKCHRRLYGERHNKLAPHLANVWISSPFRSYIFARLKTYHFQICQFYLFLGALSSGVNEFSWTCLCHKLKKKNVEGSVVKCESSVDVIKRDFGNQYLEWKEDYNNKRLNRLIETT